MLDQYGDDNEWDINGQMEEELLEMNEKMFELTGDKQKYKFDYRKDGKLDISFVRLDKRGIPNKGWNMNYPDYFIQKKDLITLKNFIIHGLILTIEMVGIWEFTMVIHF